MKRLGTLIGALLVAILIVGAAWAGEITGQVVGISDGDTVLLLVDRQGIWVRLNQIDAPEKGQAFGGRSKQSLSRHSMRGNSTPTLNGYGGVYEPAR